jgi:hypothetical protein
VVIGYDANRNMFLLDGYRHKMGLTERWLRIKTLRKKWLQQPGVQSVYVGYERYGLLDALEYFEQQMEREGDAFPITELNWPLEGPGSKYDRIQRLEPTFRLGKFYMAGSFEAETADQRRAREGGAEFLIFTPPKAVDHEQHVYRLNKALLDEYLVYPFSPHDDVLDACSRIFDMDPTPPVIVDQKLLEPEFV